MLIHAGPVEIEISQDGNHVNVRPVSEDYLRMARVSGIPYSNRHFR